VSEEPAPSVPWHPSAEPEPVSVTFYAPSVYTVSETSSLSGESSLSVNVGEESAAPLEKVNSNANAKRHDIFVIRPAENQNITSLNLKLPAGSIPANVEYVVVFAKGAEGARADLRRAVETYLRAQLRHHLDNKFLVPADLVRRNAARGEVRAWLCRVRRGAARDRLEAMATA
jgi:hypothetical protein